MVGTAIIGRSIVGAPVGILSGAALGLTVFDQALGPDLVDAGRAGFEQVVSHFNPLFGQVVGVVNNLYNWGKILYENKR